MPSGHVIIVECKNRDDVAPADRKQVMNYVDVLGSFHSQSRDLTLHAVVLLLQGRRVKDPMSDGVNPLVVNYDGTGIPALVELLERLLVGHTMIANPINWLSGEFTPRNEVAFGFMAAARQFVGDARKRAVNAEQSTALVSWIGDLVQEAKSKSEHKLVLVSAAPSSEV